MLPVLALRGASVASLVAGNIITLFDSKEMTFTPVSRNLVIGLVYFKHADPMKMRLELPPGLVKISKCGDTEVHAVPRSEVIVTDFVVLHCQDSRHSSVRFV